MPNSLDVSLQQFHGSRRWKTELAAKRDVAFQAYIGLYHAGLINDHLLPLISIEETELQVAVEKRPSLVTCAGQVNPWVSLAKAWSDPDIYESFIKINLEGSEAILAKVVSPLPLLKTRTSTNLYWNTDQTYNVEIATSQKAPYDIQTLAGSSQFTTLLFRTAYPSKVQSGRSGVPLLCAPVDVVNSSLVDLACQWTGTQPSVLHLKGSPPGPNIGLIRNMSESGKPYIFEGFEYVQPSEENLEDLMIANGHETEQILHVRARRLWKRTNFLHKVHADMKRVRPSAPTLLPASFCRVDNLPFVYSQLGLFFPSIMHHIEISLVAEQLCDDILPSVGFTDSALVRTAISASAANEASNYQRLEFLGDSALKFSTAVNLMAEHKNWHEGYLSSRKDHIVSNSQLAKVARRIGLDKYILTKAFTGDKWRPTYNEDLVDHQPEERMLSTKVLADVMEAILGAALLDGGLAKAVACLSVFGLGTTWRMIPECNELLYLAAQSDQPVNFPYHYAYLETLIGHTFSCKSLLLEAITHPSYISLTPSCSYQRLEFLGDSVLDFIVTKKAFHHTPDLSHEKMHTIRTTVVNANFLAFHCMKATIAVTRAEPVQDNSKTTGKSFSTTQQLVLQSIWHFMRHTGNEGAIALAQRQCQEQFLVLHDQIMALLDNGKIYPWSLLARFEAPKFFSDIIESVIGAIYIDSRGDLSACESFLSKLGITQYLEKVLENNIHLIHPKEELGRVAVEKAVKYDCWAQENAEGEKDQEIWSCRISIGGVEMCTVDKGRNKFEVETRGAEEAVRIIKARGLEDKKVINGSGCKGDRPDTVITDEIGSGNRIEDLEDYIAVGEREDEFLELEYDPEILEADVTVEQGGYDMTQDEGRKDQDQANGQHFRAIDLQTEAHSASGEADGGWSWRRALNWTSR